MTKIYLLYGVIIFESLDLNNIINEERRKSKNEKSN